MATQISHPIREHPVTAFYLLAFTISWLGWIPLLAATHGIALFANPLWQGSLILPAIGPALAAALTLRLMREPRDFGQRLRGLFRWRIGLRWLLFSIAVPPLLVLAAGAASHGLPHPGAHAAPPLSATDILVFGVLSLLANPWEEIGWRGFALSRLQERYQPVVATLIVGTMSVVWHIPIFFVSQGPIAMSSVPFWPWSIDVMAHTFIMTWLFNRSGRSLLTTSLFHVAMNVSGAIMGITSYPALAVVEISVVIGLLLLNGPKLPYEDTALRS